MGATVTKNKTVALALGPVLRCVSQEALERRLGRLEGSKDSANEDLKKKRKPRAYYQKLRERKSLLCGGSISAKHFL